MSSAALAHVAYKATEAHWGTGLECVTGIEPAAFTLEE